MNRSILACFPVAKFPLKTDNFTSVKVIYLGAENNKDAETHRHRHIGGKLVCTSAFLRRTTGCTGGKKHFCDVDLHFCPANKWANETADCSPIADVGVIYFLILSLLALAGQE